jgi:hypothetical protein
MLKKNTIVVSKSMYFYLYFPKFIHEVTCHVFDFTECIDI